MRRERCSTMKAVALVLTVSLISWMVGTAGRCPDCSRDFILVGGPE